MNRCVKIFTYRANKFYNLSFILFSLLLIAAMLGMTLSSFLCRISAEEKEATDLNVSSIALNFLLPPCPNDVSASLFFLSCLATHGT